MAVGNRKVSPSASSPIPSPPTVRRGLLMEKESPAVSTAQLAPGPRSWTPEMETSWKSRWTADGRIVYPSRTGENWDIWIVNRDGSENKQLTADAFIDQTSSVSPDGRYIVFQSNRAGNWNIWRMDSDGGNPKQLTEGSSADALPVCSPDGRWVVFMSVRSGKWTIWKVPIDGGPAVQVTDHLSLFPSISPDGKLISYAYIDVQA